MLWKMQFHPGKCQVIRQWKVPRRPHLACSYRRHGSQSIKDLRVFETKSWRMHQRCDGSLHNACKTILEYASPAWDPSSNEDIAKLAKVQRQAARFVHYNYYDRTPGCVSKMVSDLGWESLQERRRVEWLTTLFKVQPGLVEIDIIA